MSRLPSVNNGQRPVTTTTTVTNTNTTGNKTANAPANRPLDAFTGMVRNLAQQPVVQAAVTTGVRMMLGVNGAALAQRLQALLPNTGRMTPAQAQAQAQADVNTLLASNPNPRTSQVVALIAQHPNDPEYAANVIGALPPEFQGGQLLVDVNNVTGIGGRDGKQLLLSAMKLARDHQPPLLDMGTLSQSPAYTPDLENGMNSIADPAATLRNMAMNSVEVQAAAIGALNETAQASHAQLQELNAQLGRQLEQYGPGLTQAQKDAYIAAFKAQHPEYAAAEAADNALASYLQVHQGRLQQAALDPSNAAAADIASDTLSSAYQTLAGTAHNQLVVNALQVPGLLPQLAQSYPTGAQDFHDKVVNPAAQNLMSSAAAGGNPDTILEQLNTLYGSMTQVPALADQANTALTAFRRLGDALHDLGRTGNGQAFGEALNSISEDAGTTSNVGKLIAGGGFLMGVARIAEGVGRGGAEGSRQAMEGMMQTLQNSPAIGYGLEILAEHFPKVISAEMAQGVSGVLEDVSAFLGVLTSGMSFLDGMADAAGGDATTGDKMKLMSDLLGVAGGVALLLGANVFGAVAGVLGLVTSLAGDALHNAEQDQKNRQFDEETWRILSDPSFQPPIDPNLLQTLKDLPAGSAQTIADGLGMTPEQFVSMANDFPGVLSNLAAITQESGGAAALKQLRTELGLSPGQVAQLASTHLDALQMLTLSPQTQSLRSLAAIQDQLGLNADQTFQLLMELANNPPQSLDLILNQVGSALSNRVASEDPRVTLQRLRDAGASTAPDLAAGIDLILRTLGP